MSSQNVALPAPLMTSEPGSFAQKTIVERKPQIIRRVLEDNDYPPDIVQALRAFREEIVTQAIASLSEQADDVNFWNNALAAYRGKTWLEVPWYFAETYFYRRLLEAVHYFQPGPWQGRDPFSKQKREQETAAVAQLTVVWEQVEQIAPDARFELLLHSCLWGNRADLSNFTIRESAHRGLDAHEERPNILIDHTDAVYALLHKGVHRVAFINDNVGADSLFDLVLADFLLNQRWAQEIVFCLKDRPFFVSDAMPEDIRMMVAHLQALGDVNDLGKRLNGYLHTGQLHTETGTFWTSCLAFNQMPPPLRDELARADLIILKGDVNYRRLLDDRHWPHTTPIETIAGTFPKPFLILRTLKGEIMVSLHPGQAAALTAEDPTWLINGKRGIIQLVI